MEVQLLVNNQNTLVTGQGAKVDRALARSMSYMVDGHEHSPSFQRHAWDGKVKLYKYNKTNGYHFPTGLLPDAVDVLKRKGIAYKIVDKRPVPESHEEIVCRATDLEDRDYQDEAVDAITDYRRSVLCRGIYHASIRSGKTIVAARVIDRLKWRTIFIVNSDLLLEQTVKSFKHYFGMDIGVVGSGKFDPKLITVASIQTLTPLRGKLNEQTRKRKPLSKDQKKRNRRMKEFLDSADLMFFDECHHLEAEQWRKTVLGADVYAKIGLTATLKLSQKGESETGAIWLKACTGPILYRVSMTRMIEEGWLIRPEVRILENSDGPSKGGWPTAYKDGIAQNDDRNMLVADLARLIVTEIGMRVAIHVQQHAQLHAILGFLKFDDFKVEGLYGDTKSRDRQRVIADLVAGRTSVMVGTIFREGVDIPELGCVINAEGGNDEKSTIQKLRNLTPPNGRVQPGDRALCIDFADSFNKYLAKHSETRIATYLSEPAFDVRVVDVTNMDSILKALSVD